MHRICSELGALGARGFPARRVKSAAGCPGSAAVPGRRVKSEPVGFGLWAIKLTQAPRPTEPCGLAA